ncbi:MAG: hypothetical protein H6713_17865 [Myxococcales bacterium]|nr:hypothetical protein [Myxococcales bacterium]MCB9751843.1 hypothetical protein [Myxococcales bacterium]
MRMIALSLTVVALSCALACASKAAPHVDETPREDASARSERPDAVVTADALMGVWRPCAQHPERAELLFEPERRLRVWPSAARPDGPDARPCCAPQERPGRGVFGEWSLDGELVELRSGVADSGMTWWELGVPVRMRLEGGRLRELLPPNVEPRVAVADERAPACFYTRVTPRDG